MSNDQIVVLSIITGSFLVFAAALAWADALGTLVDRHSSDANDS